jgi:hypothetical protein
MTTLPRDNDNTPIPALRLNPNGAHKINAVTANAVVNTIAFDQDTRVIGLYATGAVYIKFGNDASVAATSDDHFFPSGLYYDMAIGGDKTLHTPYISVLAVDSDCTVYISEKQ